MTELVFPGRLAIQQRVLPTYRSPFFDSLAQSCEGGLSVFAGEPRPDEHISTVNQLNRAVFRQAHNVHFLNVQSVFYYCWQKGLINWLENWQPDVLIAEANPRYLRTRNAVEWMHQRGRPVLGWGLGAPPIHGRIANWRRQERKRFIQQYDGMIAYSQRGAEEYAALGIPTDRIFVALNAVSPKPTQAFLERGPDFSGSPVVLFVGRLQARKRIDNLLLACASLLPEKKPRLIVVGDGPAREEFEKMAQEVYPATQFTGALHGAELDAYFKMADLFVLPGTGGLAVQQAMSFGLPVIVAQGDGTQDDLVRPTNGWTIPSNDLEALQSSLNIALDDVLSLRKKGAESYRIVSQEINLERMVSIFLQAVNTVFPDAKRQSSQDLNQG
ncbi:MAG TPA: glycosyltransferase family 4 protein [Anaerolineales bacterium]|nr:glycosyltransferase family 4 protein [Anaerolineales bacterium]